MDPSTQRDRNTTDPLGVANNLVPAMANRSIRPIHDLIDLGERARTLTAPSVGGNAMRMSPTAQLMTQSTPQGGNANIQASVGNSQSTVLSMPDEPLNNLSTGRPEAESNRSRSADHVSLEDLSDQENEPGSRFSDSRMNLNIGPYPIVFFYCCRLVGTPNRLPTDG